MTQVIREALARGADRAIHVEDDALGSADALAIADALAGAMRDEAFDLILTGLQSDDQGHAQTGVVLAARLGVPHATIIMEVQVADGRAAREARARGRLVPVGGDAAAGGADHPERHQPAALRDAEGHHGGEEEGDSRGRAGIAGAAARSGDRCRSTCRRRQSRPRCIAGSAAEAAATLVRKLREDARVIAMILVVAEQRGGKLNRASWEAIAAAQQLAAGAPVVGRRSPAATSPRAAAELAAAAVAEVIAVDRARA